MSAKHAAAAHGIASGGGAMPHGDKIQSAFGAHDVSGIQAHAPVAMRGRVMSMYSITSQVVPALSGVAAGALVNAVGVTWAIALAGVTLAGIMLFAAWRMPRLRSYNGQS